MNAHCTELCSRTGTGIFSAMFMSFGRRLASTLAGPEAPSVLSHDPSAATPRAGKRSATNRTYGATAVIGARKPTVDHPPRDPLSHQTAFNFRASHRAVAAFFARS